jgi:hypothetical protein
VVWLAGLAELGRLKAELLSFTQCTSTFKELECHKVFTFYFKDLVEELDTGLNNRNASYHSDTPFVEGLPI